MKKVNEQPHLRMCRNEQMIQPVSCSYYYVQILCIKIVSFLETSNCNLNFQFKSQPYATTSLLTNRESACKNMHVLSLMHLFSSKWKA
jgi:hypothetical protein